MARYESQVKSLKKELLLYRRLYCRLGWAAITMAVEYDCDALDILPKFNSSAGWHLFSLISLISWGNPLVFRRSGLFRRFEIAQQTIDAHRTTGL